MKKLLIILMSCFAVITAHAQSDIRINSYLENSYYINPASINKHYTAELSMVARKQWTNFPGSPRTFYATATTYFEDYNTQIGLKAFTDKIGYTSSTNIALSYAYNIKLTKEWFLLLGINGSYENLSYDQSQINMQDDPYIYDLSMNRHYFNSDFGFEFRHFDDLRIGFSSRNLFSLFTDNTDQEKRLQTNSNYLYIRNRSNISHFLDLGYGACGIQYGDFYQLELNFSTFLRWRDDEYVQLGLMYRTKNEIGFLLGFDVTPQFRIAYSYDYHTGVISNSSNGTHELMLTVRLGKLFNCNCSSSYWNRR